MELGMELVMEPTTTLALISRCVLRILVSSGQTTLPRTPATFLQLGTLCNTALLSYTVCPGYLRDCALLWHTQKLTLEKQYTPR